MTESSADNCSLWKRWNSISDKTPDKDAIVHWKAGEEPCRWTYSSIISQAEKFASFLLSCGIKKGNVCAIVIRHNYYFYPLYLAVSSVGAIPAVLAYPNSRLHPDKFRQGIEGMSQRSGLDFILTEKEIEGIISPLVKKDSSTIKGIFFPLEWLNNFSPIVDIKDKISVIQSDILSTDPALLQHSSGTTGLQKPVLLSHKAVLEHIRNYSVAINLNQEDKIISWLPLYHDMGLIAAFHLPLASGVTVVQIDPFEWVMAPVILLEAISRESGSIVWLPNFAYNVLADKIHFDELEGISLESLRLVINCSEPVRNESHEKFYSRFSDFGLKENVLSTCYAMAETTFAVTQSVPGKPVLSISAERQELSKGKIVLSGDSSAAGRICVSSGMPIKGCEIRIVGENGEDLEQGNVGEIVIRSVSMFDGYRNYPEKTADVLKTGWYYSGDFGFIHNENCFVIGRKKDIIIVAGNNLYPEDIEDTVSQVLGVIPGRVVAFGEEDQSLGSEQVSVIAETGLSEEKDLRDLRMQIVKAAMLMDVSIRKVYLVPPRWLIKSSAGKPSRKANKDRILLQKEEYIWS